MFDVASAPELHRRWQTPCFEKLNNLDWPVGFSMKCFGVRTGVRANDSALLEQLRARMPADARPYKGAVVDSCFSAVLGGIAHGSRTRRFHLLYHNHEQLYRGHHLDRLFELYESYLRLSIAALAPRRTFVHAGVVGWKGRAILLPGRSLAGKTTLTAELVRAGASYFSDEYAVLDECGRVHPFRKPLSVRASRTARQVDVPVEEIGGHAAKRPLPVGLVVMSRYKPGATWRPRPLSPGKGALAMLEHAVNGRLVPQRVMASIHRVACEAAVVRTSRDEASEVAPRLLRMVEQTSRV